MTTTTGRPRSGRHDSGEVAAEPALILPLDQATDPRLAGSKAAGLAVLGVAGFRVPAGLVIPTTVFARAVAASGTDVGRSLHVPDELAAALAEAVAPWGDVPLAIRSSGVDEDLPSASYAGLYTTVLNVLGVPSLLDAVGRCWESAFSAGVAAYRQEREETSCPLMAVLVQPMLHPDAAGVAFTADPVTGERDVVVIDAVPGSGELLVSGRVTPERWTVRGDDAQRADGEQPASPALMPELARAVAELARQVQDSCGGQPQDVEWAVADEQVWLLQARPITKLPEPPPVPVEVPVEVPDGFWAREASHSALPWTRLTREVLAARNPALRVMADDLGLLIDGVAVQDIGGWEYLRIVPLGGKEPPPLPAWAAPIAFRLVPSLRRRIQQAVASAEQDVPMQLVRSWSTQERPELAQRIATLRDVDLGALDDAGLADHLRCALDLAERGFLVHFRLHGALAMVLGELAFTCRELLGWENDHRWLALVAGTSTTSTSPARALSGLASTVAAHPPARELVEQGAAVEAVLGADPRLAEQFAAYLREFGCRALCYELAEDALDERPDLVLGLVRDLLAAGYDMAAQDATLRRRRAEAAADARGLLAGRPPADRDRFDRALSRALTAYPVREDNEFFTVSAPLALVRRAVLEMGARLVRRGLLASPGDVFHLEPGELRAALADGTDVRAVVARRRGERAWVLAHPGPATYGRPPSAPPPLSALPAPARQAMERFLWTVEQIMGPDNRDAATGGPQAQEVRGLPASPGTYTGPVRVIRTEAEFDRLRSGDVLVCPVTSPVWSVLFPLVGALVTDAGGVLSHPAIIAREYAVPAVVATGTATSRLRDGQLVTVDGGTGTVRVLP
jgi:phosphohistidine swiveling domain-containing protein